MHKIVYMAILFVDASIDFSSDYNRIDKDFRIVRFLLK